MPLGKGSHSQLPPTPASAIFAPTRTVGKAEKTSFFKAHVIFDAISELDGRSLGHFYKIVDGRDLGREISDPRCGVLSGSTGLPLTI